MSKYKQFLLALTVCALSLLTGMKGVCQIDQAKLLALKEKYTWGSIYITNITCLHLSSILEDQTRFIRFKDDYSASSLTALRSFLKQHRNLTTSLSIAFIEIDLNRIEAGFKKADDPSGAIHPIAWSKQDVVQIAALCDHELNEYSVVMNTMKAFMTDSVSVYYAYAQLRSVTASPYVSLESTYLLEKEFRKILLKARKLEIEELPNSTRIELAKFVMEFDEKMLKISNHKIVPIAGGRRDAEFLSNLSTMEKTIHKTD